MCADFHSFGHLRKTFFIQATMPAYGQVVIGPPGSGKSTYCAGMAEFLRGIGRKVAVINLDPANENVPYKCDINISSLITLSDVMDNLKLGPNGGLVYCMEYLDKNMDWLEKELGPLKDCYLLFDCPGQVELYTYHSCVRNIVRQMERWDYRLVAVHLVDSHYCSDPSKFVSILLTSLATMIHIELPHVNVLSKMDLIEKFGKLAFGLDFYTEVLDLSQLLEHLQDHPFTRKYKKLNEVLTGVVEDYSLVTFSTLDIQNKESLFNLMKNIDKTNGYVFGGSSDDGSNFSALMASAVGADFEFFNQCTGEVPGPRHATATITLHVRPSRQLEVLELPNYVQLCFRW